MSKIKTKFINKCILIGITLVGAVVFGGFLISNGIEVVSATKPSSSILASLSISNAPRIGEAATLTLSVTPLRDGPWMEVGFKVPDGIEVVSAIGTRSMIEEIRQPPSLQIRQQTSMKAGETRAFEMVVRVLREGRFEISGGQAFLMLLQMDDTD